MSKVLFISYDGMTDPLGQSQVIPYLQGLTALGHEISILSFEKKNRWLQLGNKIQQLLDDSNIKWYPKKFTKKPPLLSKWYDNRVLNKTVQQLHRTHQYNFLHCRSYIAAGAGYRMLKKTGLPFLFDMRGFWVDERVDNGQWNQQKFLYRWLYRFYKAKEKKYLAAAPHIISLTQCAADEMVQHMQVPTNKITVIPCCVDLEHFNYTQITSAEKAAAKEQLGLPPDVMVLSYLGSVGGWYLVTEMMLFFKELLHIHPEAHFLFITHDAPEKIKTDAIKTGVPPEKILVIPAQRAQVPALLSVSTLSIFFIKDAYSKKASSPTKQGEIMAMGIPLICNDIGDTGKIINDTATGYVVNDFSTPAIKEAVAGINTLVQIPAEQIRAAASQYFNLANGVQQYHEVYQLLDS